MKRKRSRSWAAHNVIRNGEGAMMKQFMRALLCLCLLLPLGAKAEEFSDVFVFGDSLSDTGNLAVFANLQVQSLAPFLLCEKSGSGPIPCKDVPDLRVGLCFAKTSDLNNDGVPDLLIFEFPCDDLFFMNSRVSNGPVAVEVLAERLGFDDLQPSLHPLLLLGLPRPFVGTNYAVAGAHARVRIDPKTGLPELEDLGTQIFAFLEDLPFFPEPSEALYVIFIGGNDVIDAAKALAKLVIGSTPEETPGVIIDAAVDAIRDNINVLSGAGARKFLVVNSPNIGSIPATRMRAEEEGIPPALLIGLATLLTIKFNEQLKERLEQIRAEQQQIGNPVEIKEFNLFRFFEVVRFVGKLFGVFENIKDPCFDSEAYRDDNDGDIAERIFHPGCGVDEFDDFVFFDAIHPTGRVHKFVGKALSRAAHKLIDD